MRAAGDQQRSNRRLLGQARKASSERGPAERGPAELTRPLTADEADVKGKDASVKRNTALLKKLRSLSEETRVATCEDICRTNQGKVRD